MNYFKKDITKLLLVNFFVKIILVIFVWKSDEIVLCARKSCQTIIALIFFEDGTWQKSDESLLICSSLKNIKRHTNYPLLITYFSNSDFYLIYVLCF